LDSSVLEELTNHNDGRVSEVATRLLDIRKSEKLLKNYYSKYIDTAYLHPDMHVLGADTGRTTSSNPSIQNVPLAVRKTFTSRFEHGKIASFDLDRNELVCAVLLSGDEVMAKALLEYDYHTYVASIAFGVEYDKVTKEQRKIAKIVTFGALLYGGSARGIAHRVGVEKEIVQGAIDKVKASFKKLTHYQDNQIEYAQNHLRIIDCFGKIRDLRMVNQFGSYGAVQRDAMNTPVQGLGGYICLMLYSYIHKRLIDENMQSVLIFQVHDEIIADVPFDEIERFKEIKEEAFRWLNNHEYLRQLPGYGLIKFSGDLSFGNNVLEAKESGE
jgi:DNA polymerase-1